MSRQIVLLFLFSSIVCFSQGCKGPKGDTGPAGPAGSGDSTINGNAYALRFPGNAGEVDIPYSPVYKNQTLTVECWVYVDSLYSAHIPLIMATNIDQRNTADGFGLKFESGDLYLTLATASNVTNGYVAAYTPPLKQWIHLAGTFNGLYVTLYIDGQQVAQHATTQTVWYGTRGLTLGAGFHTDFGGWSFFRGMMDEIRIWNYARSASQIQQSMRTRVSRTELGLVGYWNFDDDRISALAQDGSMYHNHGVIWGDTYLDSETPF